MLRDEQGEKKTALSCRLRPRKAPHSCALTLKPARDSAGEAGAADFKRKASLLWSQLWVKDPRGTCSEVTPNQILSDSRMLLLENGNPKVKLCVVVLGLLFCFCYLHCCSVQCIFWENWEIRMHMM